MNADQRLQLIEEIAEEIITKDELKQVLKEKKQPVVYDGFEPSGLAHLPFGVYRALLLENLNKANVKMKLYLADWHAWINNKMGGKLDNIKKTGRYFLEVWKAAGVDMDLIEPVWASELVDNSDYWETVLKIAKNHTLNRSQRALTIAGRQEAGSNPTSMLFYPSMQVADIFYMDIDICQLGMDQRRANMLARDVANSLDRKKPVAVHHHMLAGLQKPEQGFDQNEDINQEIASKMSKSKPKTCIFVHDEKEEIEEKINGAYCPQGQEQGNPLLDYAKELIFRANDQFVIERKQEYGGDMTYNSYQQLRDDFAQEEIHPQDLKKNLAREINKLVQPIRNHFKENEEARQLYQEVKDIYERSKKR